LQPANRSISALLISVSLFLCAGLLFVTAVLTALTAFLPLFSGKNIQAQGTIIGCAFGFEAMILFAATYFCFQKYNRSDSVDLQLQPLIKNWQALFLIIGSALAFTVGYLVEKIDLVNWLMLPILTIPAVVLPILLILSLGVRNIQLGPRWRAWGIFGLGMTLGPILLVFIEIFSLFVIIVLVITYLMSQPGLTSQLQSLSNQLNHVQGNPQAILNLLMPYALNTKVIMIVLLFIAGFVPFTEELIKPIGVWIFANKLDSPAQGFALGVLSGAAYGLVETLGSSGQTTLWAPLLFTRIGTSLLHITTTGLMGWGIALAFKQRQYLKLLLLYLCSAALHGSWNASVILYSYSLIAKEQTPVNLLGKLGPYMIAIALCVIVILLLILILINKRFNQKHNDAPIENTVDIPT